MTDGVTAKAMGRAAAVGSDCRKSDHKVPWDIRGRQQFPMEAAFAGPHKIATRMDGFDIGKIADADARRSIADVTSPDSLQEVRAFKKAAKAAAKEQ